MWRSELNASIVAGSKFTYERREDKLTGTRSYMPLISTAPLMKSGGRPRTEDQSLVTATPQRWPPDEWPPT
jgi:hypothetical protein